ncbi:MAG: DNA polymerase IV, partial [Actinobacteria bacterium]
RERTFQQDIEDAGEIRREVAALARQLVEDLKDDGRLAERVVVKVRFKPFFTSTHGVPLPEPSLEPDALEAGAMAALAKFELDRPVRLLGVRLELAPPA